jgi:protein-tyrosine phosphatase
VKLLRERLQRRALHAWRSTDAPLILCYGNINRSPFAAAIARRRPASRAVSAGFYRPARRPSPEATAALAARYGVDLSEHRSIEVDPAMLDAAGAIFVFDLQNLVRLAARRPRALARAHLIGSLGDHGEVLIPDPHGRGEDVLERTFAQIASAIEQADGGR